MEEANTAMNTEEKKPEGESCKAKPEGESCEAKPEGEAAPAEGKEQPAA